MISLGHKIDTHFRVKVLHDGTAKEMDFADLLTRRTIVSVYMRNNTPTCDRQNDSLVAHAAAFDRAGYNLVAISRDTCGSHTRYAAVKGINYTLVSDPKDQFARATDSLIEKSMYGRTFIGPARAAYILDTDGTVLAVLEKIDPAKHGAEVEELIKRV